MELSITKEQAETLLEMLEEHRRHTNQSRDGWITEDENAAIEAFKKAVNTEEWQ